MKSHIYIKIRNRSIFVVQNHQDKRVACFGASLHDYQRKRKKGRKEERKKERKKEKERRNERPIMSSCPSNSQL